MSTPSHNLLNDKHHCSSSEYPAARSNEYIIKTFLAKKSSPVTLILVYQTVDAQTEKYKLYSQSTAHTIFIEECELGSEIKATFCDMTVIDKTMYKITDDTIHFLNEVLDDLYTDHGDGETLHENIEDLHLSSDEECNDTIDSKKQALALDVKSKSGRRIKQRSNANDIFI